ncbi:ABC transporter permease [Mucilaginibacter psychrotolerans]|uniref:ABC transporter permease n=1 Tax=Mucilaginibacter psychrotolerans TaxID=1524096 RepID=A0A4Y8S4Q8_9SPHI|nr:ABC transporter permease [Mucilaginibacter psychrotolerans]TFF33457.1 ABC transporter permease [Mucilaginibacter psychrotolerans]
MIKNYIKVAWRNLVKHKVYSALNIGGLAIGIAVTMLIGLWGYFQYSFDRFLPGYEQAYQVRRNFNSNGDTLTFSSTSLKLADALRSQIPEIEYVAETDQVSAHGLRVGETKLFSKGIFAAEDFLKIFPYAASQGNLTSALKDPYSIVITASTAKALFGTADAVNKVVRFDNHDNLKVTAVIKDLPANSTFQFKYLVPFKYFEISQNWVKEARTSSFADNNFWQFVKLRPGVSYSSVAAKIRDIEKGETSSVNAINSNVIMQPMKDWHLYNSYKNGKATGGFIEYVRMFTIIGVFVLLIACINFVNLSTARFEKRAREVGVRKAIGSGRNDLIVQFLAEAGLVVAVSFALCLFLVQLVLPYFNSLTGTTISIPFESPVFWLIAVASVAAITLIAGSRPAFYLSSFKPVMVLKGSVKAGRGATLSRKLLVILQFSCSIALIISTVVIYNQIQYAKNRPTGYHLNRLVTTDMNEDLSRNYPALKNELIESGVVEAVTTSSSPATGVYSHGDVDSWAGKYPGETVELGYITASDGYLQTLGMQLLSGREFIKNSQTDSLSLILNEAAVKRLRLKDPLNQTISKNGKQYRIVGVVKDALMDSPYANADPTAFVNGGGWNMIYRLSAGVDTRKAIEKLTGIFNKYNPAFPYDYRFVDDDYNQKFNEELLVGKLSAIFATLAIFVSCLGLFGMAAFIAQQRIKEIGVRKVLGASITQLWFLLSKDFLVLVILSCLIASPIAWLFLEEWLQKYTYRITIGPRVFCIATLSAIIITITTVSYQSIKAALTNPVKSLKTE